MGRLKLKVAFLSLAATALADTRVYNFTVGWVNRNPDGLHERRVMGINGQWPIPAIHATVGDQVIVNLQNDLGDVPCSLHFHGLFMNGTNHMDGVGSTTQCPVPVNSSFTYAFNVTQPGTYWYHSHVDGQYPDGLRGPLLVHDPENPFKEQFDEELVLTLSDWYHDEMPELIPSFLSLTNPTGAEPVPKSALMNDTQNLPIRVEPNKTYFIRIINMAAFAGQYFWIEGHSFRVVELDGVYHNPYEADMAYIATAQRIAILLTTKNETTDNFAVVGAMDTDMFDKVPEGLDTNVTSYLVYNEAAQLPEPKVVDKYSPFDDSLLTPYDNETLYEEPAMSFKLDMKMDNLGNGVNYAFFNDVTYIRPVVPSLYTALTTGNESTNAVVYGVNANPLILEHNQVVEIVLNNHDPGKHPFHLHGHNFQVVTRSDEDAGDWDPESVRNGSLVLPIHPMRRDTLVVRPNGHFVIRFRSDNPGVWLFHCHIEWHVDSGLIMTIVEAPLQLQQQLLGKIPEDHYAACRAQNMKYEGNAAGNTVDFFDTAGMAISPKPLPAGFTPKGIVALTFSILAGLLGIGVITWYGLGEISAVEQVKEMQKIDALAKQSGVVEVSSVDAAEVTERQANQQHSNPKAQS